MAYRRTIPLRDGRSVELPAGTRASALEERYWGELVRGQAAIAALGFVALVCLANAALAFSGRLAAYGDLAGAALASAALVSAVSFLIWLHRSVKNAWWLRIRPLDPSPSWAVLCWFVPLANLVHPLRVIKSLHDASDPELLDELDEVQEVDNPSYRAPAIRRLSRALDWDKPLPLGVWWSCFLAGGFMARATMWPLSDLHLGWTERMVGWALSGHLALGVAAVAAILVIRSVVARRAELYRRVSLIVDRDDHSLSTP